jgi:hypothetical protein
MADKGVPLFGKFFPFLVKQSFLNVTNDPNIVLEMEEFEITKHPVLGDYPTIKLDLIDSAKFWMIKNTYNLTGSLMSDTKHYYENTSEAIKGLENAFSEYAPQVLYKNNIDDLSDESTFRQILNVGFRYLKQEDKDVYSLDMNIMQKYEYKKDFNKLGGKAYIDNEKLLYISYEGVTYYPYDEKWEYIKKLFRSSLFTYVNSFIHVLEPHLLVGGKSYIATYALSENHPLKKLLLPYLYKIPKNLKTASLTVFGPYGVGSIAIGITGIDEFNKMIKDFCDDFSITLPSEYKTRHPEIYPYVNSIWKVIHNHVQEYCKLYNIDEKDIEIRKWRNYLAENLNLRAKDLPIDVLISYIIYICSFYHYVTGHMYVGNINNEYIGTSISSDNIHGEQKLHTIMRASIITSINKAYPKFLTDWSFTAPTKEGADILYNMYLEFNKIKSFGDIKLADMSSSSGL